MKRDDLIFDIIEKEHQRQLKGIELIASENFVSDQVMQAMGSCLTNKYAEGYPGKRYYGGCEVVDQSEQIAIDRLKQIFGAEWANVQPHSGAQANAAVFLAVLNPGDKFMGLNLAHGGHLSHGSLVNTSGIIYTPCEYNLNKETGRPDTYLNGVNVENKIRSMEVSSKVSPISTLDFVREEMVAQQQAMGKEKGIVMDGRDIGTTVFPDAELKIFVTATPEIRAQRRYDELKAKGQEASFDEILENVKQRDYIDQNREVSPLRKAEDALLLDNTHLSIEEQKEWLFGQFNKVSK